MNELSDNILATSAGEKKGEVAPVHDEVIEGVTSNISNIQVMPLSLANKIAAGEVVQRPASAVKELIENALDAGASSIQILLQGAGSTLIQVIDDGCGMNEQDARLCFERHATSKIRSVSDLEAIHTLGFRGEALASIASVAQVELKTGISQVDPGLKLRLEGGVEIDSEPIAPMRGSSIAVRNLYFNVPARRNFLKRPQTELKHILDVVQVMALSNPKVAFTLVHEGNELLSVPAQRESGREALASRAESLLPISKPKKLIPLDESTSYLSVRGILGSPDGARRTRGQQFLFVNGRYVKHRYLEHAVHASYEYLLPEGSYPFFLLFLEIDPRHVDVNVHPTKAEVKFDDERGVYGMIRAVVGRALGTSLHTPNIGEAKPMTGIALDVQDVRDVASSPDRSNSSELSSFFSSSHSKRDPRAFEASRSLYEGSSLYESSPLAEGARLALSVPATSTENGPRVGPKNGGLGEEGLLWQLHDTYILTQIRSGLVIIDQQMAHERILYEQALACLKDGFGLSQQLLFPRTIEFSASDFSLLEGLMPDLKKLGFDVEAFGGNSVIVRGVPADISTGDERSVLDEIVDQYRLFEKIEKLSGRENLARSIASRGAVRAGMKLSPKEMRALIDQLFECATPFASPDGRPTMITLSGDELRERFDRK